MGKVFKVIHGTHALWNKETETYDIYEPSHNNTFELADDEELGAGVKNFVELVATTDTPPKPKPKPSVRAATAAAGE